MDDNRDGAVEEAGEEPARGFVVKDKNLYLNLVKQR